MEANQTPVLSFMAATIPHQRSISGAGMDRERPRSSQSTSLGWPSPRGRRHSVARLTAQSCAVDAVRAVRSGCRAGSAAKRRWRVASASAGTAAPFGHQAPAALKGWPGPGSEHHAGPVRAIGHRLAGRLRHPVAVDAGVQRRGGQTEPGSHLGRDRLAVCHGRHRHHQGGAAHLVRPASLAPAPPPAQHWCARRSARARRRQTPGARWAASCRSARRRRPAPPGRRPAYAGPRPC